jgi:hypothetical protein
MNRKQNPKTTAKARKGAGKKQTEAEFLASLAELPSGPLLLSKLAESGITQAEFQKRLAKYDDKARKSEAGARLHSLHMLAPFWGTGDTTANELIAELEYLELVMDGIMKDGLAAGSLEFLIVIVAAQLKSRLLYEHAAKRFPPESRDVVIAILSAIHLAFRRQQEKGSALTPSERKKLIEDSRKSIGDSLCVIVDGLFPDEFHQYVDEVFEPIEDRGPGRPSEWDKEIDLYLDLWRQKYGRRRATSANLDSDLVLQVMKQNRIEDDKYSACRAGIKRGISHKNAR